MEITQPRRLVERFYYDVWNRGDQTAAREILDPDFRFRGSLGPERIGPDGFIEYMRSIRTALADFECIIDDLIEADMRVAARMRFRGIHSGQFFGMPATGQEIIWSGAAFFTMDRGRIAEVWVLGDIDAVKQQLGARLGIVLRLTRIIAERPIGIAACSDRRSSGAALFLQVTHDFASFPAEARQPNGICYGSKCCAHRTRLWETRPG